MKAAIDRLSAIQDGRKIAILGEMYELGVEAPHAHAGIASAVNTLDQVVMVGEGFRPFAASAMASFATNASDIDLPALAASLREGDTVLVKGSNGVFGSINLFGNSLTRSRAAAEDSADQSAGFQRSKP